MKRLDAKKAKRCLEHAICKKLGARSCQLHKVRIYDMMYSSSMCSSSKDRAHHVRIDVEIEYDDNKGHMTTLCKCHHDDLQHYNWMKPFIVSSRSSYANIIRHMEQKTKDGYMFMIPASTVVFGPSDSFEKLIIDLELDDAIRL